MHVALLAFRFDDGIGWSDLAYSPHREKLPHGFAVCDLDTELALRGLLVDARTGVILAVRRTIWPAHFAQVVRLSAARLCRSWYSETDADCEQDALYLRYRRMPNWSR
ncbi:hypothetical protein [Nocardia sp. NPDC046763]|uniref:hypothetical protein n=1 Tax=Nocardia sp. NPDC046763 TaxID=3155256 RepID=UPI0034053B66